MRIWSAEHIFDNPWELVVRAQWRKYPNKFNQAVEGIDVVDRHVDSKGVLRSHRLLSTRWGLPNWAIKLIGADGVGHASEHSQVDPANKTMEMKTRNITFCNMITIDEKLVYSPHATEKNKTCVKQEAVINVYGVPLGSWIESYVCDSISKNASKGREAMDHVMNTIKQETVQIQKGAKHTIESMNLNFERPNL
ncbi:PRELI-like [Mactra antiquata]